jgi:hypothetical protein
MRQSTIVCGTSFERREATYMAKVARLGADIAVSSRIGIVGRDNVGPLLGEKPLPPKLVARLKREKKSGTLFFKKNSKKNI